MTEPSRFFPGAVVGYRMHAANTHKSVRHHLCYGIERA